MNKDRSIEDTYCNLSTYRAKIDINSIFIDLQQARKRLALVIILRRSLDRRWPNLVD